MTSCGTARPAARTDDEISSRSLLFLLLVVALGFSAHRLRPTLKRLGSAWCELTSYAVGGIMVIAVFPAMFSMVIEAANGGDLTRRRAVFMAFLALVLSFGAIGAGTTAGWLLDPEEQTIVKLQQDRG